MTLNNQINLTFIIQDHLVLNAFHKESIRLDKTHRTILILIKIDFINNVLCKMLLIINQRNKVNN